MDFPQAIAYLYSLQLFGIKLGLENTRRLLDRLDNPQAGLAWVHVAGTNGKGSVCAFLAEALRASGLRTGLYTSPHLHNFTERIRINGRAIDEDQVADLASEIRSAAGDLPITFFEATTAMALLAFRRGQVEIGVLETGLGGRLDATNIIQPILTLVTPVSYDHQEHLGSDLAAIAAEKAGIIKPGVPVVIGRQPAAAAAVLLERAAQLSAPVCLAGRDYRHSGTQADLTVTMGERTLAGLRCALDGAHQRDNLAQAVAGGLLLADAGWPVTESALRRAGESARWPGRLEWWPGRPAVLLDAAHNAAGVASLVAYLEECGLRGFPLLVGLSRGRKPGDVLKSLAAIAGEVYAVPVPAGESVAPGAICDWARQEGLHAVSCETPQAGLTLALAACGEEKPLVVCGSLFLVAAIRELLLTDRLPGQGRAAVTL